MQGTGKHRLDIIVITFGFLAMCLRYCLLPAVRAGYSRARYYL